MVASRAARGSERGRWLLIRFGVDLRTTRVAAGLTIAFVARAAGISETELSRIERGRAPWLSIELASRLCSIVGLTLTLNWYPTSDPLRDQGHAELTSDFRLLLREPIRVRTEVPIGTAGDLRAWDMDLSLGGEPPCAVELETKLRDAQALARRVQLKLRDSRYKQVLLVLRDTRGNREAYAAARATIDPLLPMESEGALRCLAAGTLPSQSGVVFVRRRREVKPGAAAAGRQLTTDSAT